VAYFLAGFEEHRRQETLHGWCPTLFVEHTFFRDGVKDKRRNGASPQIFIHLWEDRAGKRHLASFRSFQLPSYSLICIGRAEYETTLHPHFFLFVLENEVLENGNERSRSDEAEIDMLGGEFRPGETSFVPCFFSKCSRTFYGGSEEGRRATFHYLSLNVFLEQKSSSMV
jgi:hypothetical protein